MSAGKIGLKGLWIVVCKDKDGNEKWKVEEPNLIVNVWLNNLLDILYNVGGQPAALYMGLVVGTPAPNFNANDDLLGHAGWLEDVAYSEGTRPVWGQDAAAGQVIANSTPALFTITGGTHTVAGLFIIADNSVKGDENSGKLVAEVGFAEGTKNVAAGDTLQVTYQQTAASA